MKKNNLILTLVLLMSVSVIFNISCRKQEDQPKTITYEDQSSEKVVEQVKWFMDLAHNAAEGKILKSDEKLSIDDANNYISSTLNYKYCFHTASSDDIILETIIIEMPIIAADGKVLLVDAVEGYNNVVKAVREKYKLVTKDKVLLGCIVENAGFNSAGTAAKTRIIAQIGTGNDPYIPPMYNTTTQYWWTRNSMNCYDGTGNLGAPNIIEAKIMSMLCPVPPAGCRYWFPLIKQVFFNSIDYPAGGTMDNFCDYKIFRASGDPEEVYTDDVQCLGCDELHPFVHEMTFYTNGLNEIVTSFLTANAQKCQKLYIDQESIPLSQNEVAICHKPTLYYGVRMQICDETEYPINIGNEL